MRREDEAQPGSRRCCRPFGRPRLLARGAAGDRPSALAPLVSAPCGQGQAGVAIGGPRHYVRGAWPSRTAAMTKPLDELFAAEPDRLSRLTFEVAGLYFDWSKTHLDQALIDAFAKRADKMGFAAARDALFAGEIVNPSEGRAGDPCRRAGQRRAGGCRPCRPRGGSGCARWSMRSRRARSAMSPASFTSASAVRCLGRRCWSTRSAAVAATSTFASCRTSTARRSTMR